MNSELGSEPVKPTSLRHYLENDPPELDPVLIGLFDRGDKLTIVAPSKSRKSFFVLQMLICLATGRDFLGWATPKARNVLLLQYEVKECHLWRRARRMCRAMTPHKTEDDCFVVRTTLRNYPPIEDFTIRWVGQLFELALDVRPDVETNKTAANAAQRKPSPGELADYSKQWLADGPMLVNDYKDRLAAEFDVGINLAGRASTQCFGGNADRLLEEAMKVGRAKSNRSGQFT